MQRAAERERSELALARQEAEQALARRVLSGLGGPERLAGDAAQDAGASVALARVRQLEREPLRRKLAAA